MNKILSQDEVNALLKAVPPFEEPQSSDPGPEEGQGTAMAAPAVSSLSQAHKGHGKRTTVYDFRRPDRVPKPMLRSLQLLHDKFCSNLSSSLSAYLRTITEISLRSVEQTSYSEFLLSLADPTCFNAISIKPLTGMAALEMNLDLVFPLIDRLLGGGGNIPKPGRNITEIEQNLIQSVIRLVLTHLKEAWAPVTSIDFALHASEARPQLLPIATANEVVILIIFEVAMGEVRGQMHLCVPFAALESLSAMFEQDISVRRKGDQATDFKNIVKSLFRAQLLLTAELAGTSVSVKDLVSLKPGDVLKLDGRATGPLLIHVAGKPKFQSQPFLSQDRKAVRILSRLD
jgi:flagellar motor switch protein FliM